MHSRNAGFSLVELSIVLVILGLLVGGILGGQALIKAAELRKVVSDVESFRTAANAFRIKYLYFPGDMPNATQFWGDHASLCPDAAVADGDPGTCNGDGNGQIFSDNSGPVIPGENTHFWAQLSLAGIIPGQYDSDWPAVITIGEHAPRTGVSSYSFNAQYTSQIGPTDNYYFMGQYGNLLRFGEPNNVGTCNSCFNASTAYPAEDAWSVDSKMDDGKPGTGRVRANHRFPANPLGCSDTNDASQTTEAEYNLGSGLGCLQLFLL